jgi:hypothetical protein
MGLDPHEQISRTHRDMHASRDWIALDRLTTCPNQARPTRSQSQYERGRGRVTGETTRSKTPNRGGSTISQKAAKNNYPIIHPRRPAAATTSSPQRIPTSPAMTAKAAEEHAQRLHNIAVGLNHKMDGQTAYWASPVLAPNWSGGRHSESTFCSRAGQQMPAAHCVRARKRHGIGTWRERGHTE